MLNPPWLLLGDNEDPEYELMICQIHQGILRLIHAFLNLPLTQDTSNIAGDALESIFVVEETICKLFDCDCGATIYKFFCGMLDCTHVSSQYGLKYKTTGGQTIRGIVEININAFINRKSIDEVNWNRYNYE